MIKTAFEGINRKTYDVYLNFMLKHFLTTLTTSLTARFDTLRFPIDRL